MMPPSFVVDTHVLLWLLTDPSRIPDQTRATLADRRTTLIVSAASAWELSTKQRLGKLPQADALVGAYGHHLNRLGATPLDISADHALLAGSLDWAHRDPFDRMLAAQCIVEGLTLVSADAAFAGLAGLRILW